MSDREIIDVLASGAPIGIVALDAEMRVTWVNEGAKALFRRDDLVGLLALDLLHPDDIALVIESAAEFDASPRYPIPTNVRLATDEGIFVPVEVWVQHHGSNDPSLFFVVTLREASAAMHIEHYMLSSLRGDDVRDSLRYLVRSVDAQVPGFTAFFWGWNGRTFSRSVATTPCFELAEDDNPNLLWNQVNTDHGYLEITNLSALPTCVRAKAEAKGLTSCRAQSVTSGVGEKGVLVHWDDREAPFGFAGRRLLERSAMLAMTSLDRFGTDLLLRRQARTDSLTSIANRSAFMEELQRRIDRREPCVVLLIDLDGFKSVNDELGHPAGDEVLRIVALRLTSCMRAPDMVARLGGDEFAILIQAEASDGVLVELIDRVSAICDQPFAIGPHRMRVGLSLGAASTQCHPSLESVIEAADQELYRSKSSRRVLVGSLGVKIPSERGFFAPK